MQVQITTKLRDENGAQILDIANQGTNDIAPDKARTMKDILSKSRLQLPKPGEYLDGYIINQTRSHVLVDLGPLGTGIIYPSQFYDNLELQKALKLGEKVRIMMLELENEMGYREVSLKAAQLLSAWGEIRNLSEKGEIITTKIVNLNKGGLVVDVHGVQGFIPLSQLSEEHYPKIEGGDTTKIIQALQKYRNQEFTLKIIDLDEEKNKLILSEKAVYAKSAPINLADYFVGEIVEAEVSQITDFGVFVKLTHQLDGLIHISELSWDIVDDPSTLLKVGDKIKAEIISLDQGRVLLSLKALQENPWNRIQNKYELGQKLEGKIVKFDIYGARIEVEPGILALVPSKEFAPQKDQMKLNELGSFAIIEFDPASQKMILTPSN